MSYKQLEMLEKISLDFASFNSFGLKETSNTAIEQAITFFDKSTAKIATLSYALSKIVSKEHIMKNPQWPLVQQKLLLTLKECETLLKKNKQKKFQKKLERIEKNVKEVDDALGNYVRNIWDKAKIKIASTAYAHGMSLSKASELANANKNEVQNYIGITKIHDEEKTIFTIKQRMEEIRKVFL